MARTVFRVVGRIDAIEVIAAGREIRDLARLRRAYGPGRWRKLKGTCRVMLSDGRMRSVEVHWYEAHGVGRREMKIKRYL